MKLIDKIKNKLFPVDGDDGVSFLEEVNDSFMKRIKSYGYNNIEEYEISGRNMLSYQFTRSFRYPVHSDC